MQQLTAAMDKMSIHGLEQLKVVITEKCNDAKRETATAFNTSMVKTMAKVPPLDYSANDDTPEALKAAEHNASLVKNEWCKCAEHGTIAYYRSLKMGHGWMCGVCYKIVQTG